MLRCRTSAFRALTLLFGNRKTVKETDCWYFGGGDLTSLHVLRVLVVTATTSIISSCVQQNTWQSGLTFWYWLTQVILETGSVSYS